MLRTTLFVIAAIGLAACGGADSVTGTDTDEPNDQPIESTIKLLSDIDLLRVWHPPSDAGSVSVKVGIFLYADESSGFVSTWTQDDVIPLVNTLIRSSNTLAQCDLRLELEVAQVISLPERLFSVEGNDATSYGGHPPPETENPALFNYQENNRLTQDTRELFAYGKEYTSPNTIAVFVVRSILYHIKASVFSVQGLSYAPNLYHHIDDYPSRNSVLLALPLASNNLPAVTDFTTFATAHELGHMLLNSGLHNDVDPLNLMNGQGEAWPDLTADQCERMRDVQERLYGEEEVHDPGPPSS